MNVSADAARRFFVARQLLAPARSIEGGTDGVLEVFRRLGSVQFDTIAVAGRNHELVLHARVADYDPAWLEELLYDRRELFEGYSKGLSLLPTSELPWYRVPWWSVNAPPILAENAEVAEQVLDRIRAASGRRLRRRDAGGASGLPSLRGREPPRVGAPPR